MGMKKFLVVGDRSQAKDGLQRKHAFGEYLRDTVSDFGVVDIVPIDKIVFDIRKGSFEALVPSEGIDLKTYDAIYVRSLRIFGTYVSQFAAFHNIPCINDYSRYYTGSKMAQTLVFLKAGVDFLPTYYAVDNHVLATYAAHKVGYPFILKADNGARGESNYLIKSETELGQTLEAEPDIDFIAQDFCRNDRDYRLLMIGSSRLIFERRGKPDTHLNNTSKGGAVSLVNDDELPPYILTEARTLAEQLGLTIAGFDVIPKLGTNEYYFLEVNSEPQLRTGMLLEEKQRLLRALFSSF